MVEYYMLDLRNVSNEQFGYLRKQKDNIKNLVLQSARIEHFAYFNDSKSLETVTIKLALHVEKQELAPSMSNIDKSSPPNLKQLLILQGDEQIIITPSG